MADIRMSATWQGGFTGRGHIAGENFNVDIGIPTALGGSGAGANPKELFTSATLACFTATLRAITQNKKVPVEQLSVETSAEAADEAFAIHHVAHLVLTAGSNAEDVAAAQAAIQSADKVCTIGNLAKKAGVAISVAADVRVA